MLSQFCDTSQSMCVECFEGRQDFVSFYGDKDVFRRHYKALFVLKNLVILYFFSSRGSGLARQRSRQELPEWAHDDPQGDTGSFDHEVFSLPMMTMLF